MSRPSAGRLHLWFWAAAGVLVYVASCPPVEAWHEKRIGRNAHHLPVSIPGTAGSHDTLSSSSATGGEGGHQSAGKDGFQIIEVQYHEPPPRPRWMQILYAPIHWLESFTPMGSIFHHYRQWCDATL